MIKELNYISIYEVLSEILEHPLLEDTSLELAIRYTLRFIGLMGCPKMYVDRETTIKIEDYRGELPCDVISITGVKDTMGNMYRAMTDIYNPSKGKMYTFKTLGRVIYTGIKEGELTIAYKGIAIDENNYPLIPDNEVFKEALEWFIKEKVFSNLFDLGKIQAPIYQNARLHCAYYKGKCKTEFLKPSIAEMESITNMWSLLLPRTLEFSRGFRTLGSKESIL